jgi:hypothetical protein
MKIILSICCPNVLCVCTYPPEATHQLPTSYLGAQSQELQAACVINGAAVSDAEVCALLRALHHGVQLLLLCSCAWQLCQIVQRWLRCQRLLAVQPFLKLARSVIQTLESINLRSCSQA